MKKITFRYAEMQIKKINCPICNKELIRLEPFKNGAYEFWCDDCNIDIIITKNNETDED